MTRAFLTRPGLGFTFEILSHVKFLNSMGIKSYICWPNDDKVLDPYKIIFTFLRWNSDLCPVLKDLVFNPKTSVIVFEARLCFTLNISNAKVWRFFWCVVTELPFFNSSVKEEVKSLDDTQCSFVKFVSSIIQWPAMIHPYQWAVPKLWHTIRFH